MSQFKPQYFMKILEDSNIVPKLRKEIEKGQKAYFDIGRKQMLTFPLPGCGGGKLNVRYVENLLTVLKSVSDLGHAIYRGNKAGDKSNSMPQVSPGKISMIQDGIRLDYSAMYNIVSAADTYFSSRQ